MVNLGDSIVSPLQGIRPGQGGKSKSFQDEFYDRYPISNILETKLPTDIRKAISMSRAIIYTNPLVYQSIVKNAEYPITKVVISFGDDPDTIDGKNASDEWDRILNKILKIRLQLKKINMAFEGDGNAIVSVYYPFSRWVKCPTCKDSRPFSEKKDSFKEMKFSGKCKCGYIGEMIAFDVPSKNIEELSIIHWDLDHIEIEHNPISNRSTYYYKVPDFVSAKIKVGNMDYVSTTRIEIINAIKKNKKILIDRSNLWHFKKESPLISGYSSGWGIPGTLPIISDALHMRILKRGNEAVAFGHISPFRAIFPAFGGEISPHMQTNLGTWRVGVESAIKKQVMDPNAIAIMPVPVGQIQIGGDARALSVTPEISMLEKTIITGMGIIPEILQGGASWSGSNVSLRIIENSFLNIRDDSEDFISDITPNIARYFNLPLPSTKLSEFKMADDMTRKQMFATMASSGSVANSLVDEETVHKELGLDSEEIFKSKKRSIDRRAELSKREMVSMARAQGEGSIINAIYQAEAQIESQSRMKIKESEEFEKQMTNNKERKAGMSDQVMQELYTFMTEQGYDNAAITAMNPGDIILGIVSNLESLKTNDIKGFKNSMLYLKNKYEAVYTMVYDSIKDANLVAADLNPDLKLAQKYTPGEIPQNSQGGATAIDSSAPITSSQTGGEDLPNEPTAPAAVGAGVAEPTQASKTSSVAGFGISASQPLPEQRPPNRGPGTALI